MNQWVPTPTFLYRHYLYNKIVDNFSNKKSFLLIGTGNGFFVNELAKRDFKGRCVDISGDAIDSTAKLIGNDTDIKLEKRDLFKYNPKRKVQLVFCFEVIEHIKKDKEAFVKIRKLVQPGGTFVMSVPAHMKLWGNIDDIGGHFRRYEKKELQRQLQDAGFRVKRIWCYGYPILNLIRRISKSGYFVQDELSKNNINERTKKSGVRVEYNSRLKPIVTSKVFLWPAFKIMDFFLNTDLGLGYIVEAKAV